MLVLCCVCMCVMAAAWSSVLFCQLQFPNRGSCPCWTSVGQLGKAMGVLQVLRQRFVHPCSYSFWTGGYWQFSQVSPGIPPTPRNPL